MIGDYLEESYEDDLVESIFEEVSEETWEAIEEAILNELSPKTLASYVKKASDDMYDKGGKTVYHSSKANKASGPFGNVSKKKNRAAAADMERKAASRQTGISRAVDRLAK